MADARISTPCAARSWSRVQVRPGPVDPQTNNTFGHGAYLARRRPTGCAPHGISNFSAVGTQRGWRARLTAQVDGRVDCRTRCHATDGVRIEPPPTLRPSRGRRDS